MAVATNTPPQGANPILEIVDPFEVFDDVGMVNEQVDAALGIVSDLLADTMETGVTDEERAALIKRAWLLLEMTRSNAARNDRSFHEAAGLFYRFADRGRIDSARSN